MDDWERLRRQLFSYAHYRLRATSQDAEDAVQEAIVRYLIRKPEINAPLENYLMSAVRHILVSEWRKNRRLFRLSEDVDDPHSEVEDIEDRLYHENLIAKARRLQGWKWAVQYYQLRHQSPRNRVKAHRLRQRFRSALS